MSHSGYARDSPSLNPVLVDDLIATCSGPSHQQQASFLNAAWANYLHASSSLQQALLAANTVAQPWSAEFLLQDLLTDDEDGTASSETGASSQRVPIDLHSSLTNFSRQPVKPLNKSPGDVDATKERKSQENMVLKRAPASMSAQVSSSPNEAVNIPRCKSCDRRSGGTGTVGSPTTAMVRNIPANIKQSEMIMSMMSDGFAGRFDFFYLPARFDTGLNKGYAFVNFVSGDAFDDFLKVWHGKHLGSSEAGLNISVAKVQGFEANVKLWKSARFDRVRNPDFRPYIAPAVMRDASSTSSGSSNADISSDGFLTFNDVLPPPGLEPVRDVAVEVTPCFFGIRPPPGLEKPALK